MIPSIVDYSGRAASIHRNGLGLCLAVMLAGFGCAPKFVGPTDPSGYRFAVLSPVTIPTGKSAAIVVRVQDAQGQKVDDVPVSFQLAPSRAHGSSVTPTRTVTRGGRAQTTFRAGIIGPVPVRVQVENTQHELIILVDVRGEPPGGA